MDPGPTVPGKASAPSETPWEEGIQLAGVVQHIKGRKTSSLMADSTDSSLRKSCYVYKNISRTMEAGSLNQSVADQSNWLLVIHFGCLLCYRSWLLVYVKLFAL